MAKLDQDTINSALENLPGWSSKGDWITKEFKFGTFREAMGFMVQAGFEAEELNHHPNWSNVYNGVKVELQTHSEGGVTEKDIDLAGRMDKIAS